MPTDTLTQYFMFQKGTFIDSGQNWLNAVIHTNESVLICVLITESNWLIGSCGLLHWTGPISGNELVSSSFPQDKPIYF